MERERELVEVCGGNRGEGTVFGTLCFEKQLP